jgi:hypothetical protein
MLISMPTGTSTIFGVFQVIRVSQVFWREVHAERESKATSNIAQVFTLWLCVAPSLQRTFPRENQSNFSEIPF